MIDIIKIIIECNNIEEAETIDDYVGELGYSSIIDKISDNDYRVYVLFKTKINAKELILRLNTVGQAFGKIFSHTAESVDENWLENSQKSFDAIVTDNHFIYQTFYEGKIDKTKNNIIINPGQAFGTGSHETTRCCIYAIEFLIENNLINNINNAIDIGTGSGILAISLLKNINYVEVDITDIDDIAIEVSKDNFVLNNVSYRKSYVCPGFDSIDSSDYDLIISNILFKPLIDIASDISKNINKNGYIILSGILNTQVDDLILKYNEFGFKILKQFNEGEWSAIIMKHE